MNVCIIQRQDGFATSLAASGRIQRKHNSGDQTREEPDRKVMSAFSPHYTALYLQ
jgi:hypothetical protein